MNPLRTKKAVGIVVLCGALAGFGWFLMSRTGAASSMQRLPDGSVMRLGPVSYAVNHRFSQTAATGWRKRLLEKLPASWRIALGGTLGGTLVLGGNPGWTNFAVSTICQINTNGGYIPRRMRVFDEAGNYFDAGGTSGTLSASDARQRMTLDAWVFPVFPRRSRMLGLRLFEETKAGWTPVAEFKTPNPVPGNYPVWTPEPMPATKADGDLAVTLVSLKSGLSQGSVIRAADSNQPARTLALFRAVQAGRAHNSWRPKAVEISDATGNHWAPTPVLLKIEREGETDGMSIEGALWPGEAAWKLRVEFSRDADFDSGEVVTFSGIPVPADREVIALNASTNFAGGSLGLVAISGVQAEQPGDLKWVTVKNQMNLSLRGDEPSVRHCRWTLMKIADKTGREARLKPGPDWNAARAVYAFIPPEGATELNVTVAVHRSRFVEFLAKPEFPRD